MIILDKWYSVYLRSGPLLAQITEQSKSHRFWTIFDADCADWCRLRQHGTIDHISNFNWFAIHFTRGQGAIGVNHLKIRSMRLLTRKIKIHPKHLSFYTRACDKNSSMFTPKILIILFKHENFFPTLDNWRSLLPTLEHLHCQLSNVWKTVSNSMCIMKNDTIIKICWDFCRFYVVMRLNSRRNCCQF